MVVRVVVNAGIELHEKEARHHLAGCEFVSPAERVSHQKLELGTGTVGRNHLHIVGVCHQKLWGGYDLDVFRDSIAHDQQPAWRL